MPAALNTILIVDDDPAWLRTLRLLLLAEGIDQVLTCQDSRLVLDLLQHDPVNLILLDHSMPHLNAEQLLPLLKARHGQIPVIILSGQDQAEIVQRCRSLGALWFFPKTTARNTFLASIRRVLAHQGLDRVSPF